nr:nuclear envelope pore membrane protein POM 121-like [Equus caballus]
MGSTEKPMSSIVLEPSGLWTVDNHQCFAIASIAVVAVFATRNKGMADASVTSMVTWVRSSAAMSEGRTGGRRRPRNSRREWALLSQSRSRARGTTGLHRPCPPGSWRLACGRQLRPQGARPLPANTARQQQGVGQPGRRAPLLRSRVPTSARSAPGPGAANGNLAEPRTPLEGRDRAELLLMGGCLSRPRPAPPASAVLSGDPRARPERLGPAHPACRGPPAGCVHSAAPTLEPARRLSYEDLVASPRRRRHRRRIVIVHRRQYPVQQARCLFLGVFSSVPRSGPQTQPVLSACGSKRLCASVILKMASARGKVTLRLALKQTVLCMWSSLNGHLPDPCVRETLVRALEGSGQLRAKKEKDLSVLTESGKVLAKQEGHPGAETVEDQRRGSSSSGGARSAFRSLMVNGVLSSFVPRPGPLGRDFCFHSSENSLIEKSQTCFLNSCSKRNAIISSYSSTRGFPLLQRSGPGTARLQGPAASPPHVPAKKASEESHQSRSSASVEPQSQTKHEKAADVPSGQKQNLRNCSPPLDRSRPRKRKVPLLLPSRRNGPLILPPAPQLGYRVTAEDLDLEKRAAIRRINKVLEG